MRNPLLVAVMATTLVLHPRSSDAQSAAAPGVSGMDRAHLVVERLITHRDRLALSESQVHDLTALADRLRGDRGRLEVTGYDRVPGKSVPRVERIQPPSGDARRLAFRGLTPEQQRIAATILDHSERTDTAHR